MLGKYSHGDDDGDDGHVHALSMSMNVNYLNHLIRAWLLIPLVYCGALELHSHVKLISKSPFLLCGFVL